MIPRLEFIASLIFAALTCACVVAYPMVTIDWPYQEILNLRDDPWLKFYIPFATIFLLLQLVAISLIARRPIGQARCMYRTQLGISVTLLVLTGLYLAWKIQLF